MGVIAFQCIIVDEGLKILQFISCSKLQLILFPIVWNLNIALSFTTLCYNRPKHIYVKEFFLQIIFCCYILLLLLGFFWGFFCLFFFIIFGVFFGEKGRFFHFIQSRQSVDLFLTSILMIETTDKLFNLGCFCWLGVQQQLIYIVLFQRIP